MSFVAAAVHALEAYAALGLAFSVLFAWRGARAIDPLASRGTLGFRLLILPGAALLWPYLGMRWMRASRCAREPQ